MTFALIAHPARQHAHRLAAALQQVGWLHSFWTLLPDRRKLSWIPKYCDNLVPEPVFRHSLEALPSERVHVLLGPLYLQKLSASSASLQVRDLGEWAAWVIFDRWVASQLQHIRPSLVIGYEMCCAQTFLVAKKLGIRCILDAAACHYAWVDALLPEDISGKGTWAGQRLRRRKAAEIELADAIICASHLAQRTYLDAGVEMNRLAVNPPGCDKRLFKPSEANEPTGPPTFIFIGQPTYHKGFDLLVEAYERLLKVNPDAKLLVVGPKELSVVRRPTHSISFLGRLSHDEIRTCLASSDCLVLPSRCESFGMVVIEALATGVPVIVSENAGVSMAVRPGLNGWNVRAGDAEDLYRRMSQCCKDLHTLRTMRKDCPASLETFDWDNYAARAIDIIRQNRINKS